MKRELAPGKGIFADMVEESTDFFTTRVTAAKQAYLDSGGDEYVDEEGSDKMFIRIKQKLTAQGWQYKEDKFGKKVYDSLPWGDGEYRVTVALTRGVLKIDIRQWYQP